MADTETFLATPEIVAPVDMLLPEQAPASYDVSVISLAQADGLLPDWRALAAEAIEDNPFLSPAFLTPAISHEPDPFSVSFAAVWRKASGICKLTGLFPLRPVSRELSWRWPIVNRSVLWRHPLQPVGTPLISGDVIVAGETITAFLSWLSDRRPRLASLEIPALPMDSAVARLLLAEADRRSLTVWRTPDAAHSHGFHLMTSLPATDTSHVRIVRDRREVREGMEAFLCLDANTSGAQNRDALVATPRDAAFLRGVARSLALEGRFAVGLFDDGKHSAAALFVEGRQQTFLWHFVGPAETVPTIEAALASAAGLVTGKPVVAATPRPITGFWTMPLQTATVIMDLTPSVTAVTDRPELQFAVSGF